MKTFLKIVGGTFLLFVVLLVGLNLYFTDDRLKSTIMPYVDDAVGRQVEVQSMSLTFFSTFPQPGLSIQNMRIPGKTTSDTLVALDELVASVELFSLMGDQIEVSEISLRNPRFTYQVYPDGSSNIDFLMASDTTEETTSGGMAVNIPYFNVSGGQFGYRDVSSGTRVDLNDLNADISLSYADLIKSTIDLELGGLSAAVGDTVYLNKLPLSLSQQSTIDLENETISLDQGTFSIRGLALNLSGSISNWSNTLTGDLAFNSSSDNFGELMRLVPADYHQYVEDLQTRGSLAIDGTLQGPLTGESLPTFNTTIEVTDGYLKNPELPQPIQNIQLSGKASNDMLAVDKLTATAGENNLQATGRLSTPLEEDGEFSVDMDANVNLATINQFYDIGQFDIEQMGGQLVVEGQANGSRSNPKQATFDALVQLTNGSLKYAGVNKAIENITIDANATQQAIKINNMQLQAAANTFAMSGTINQPLEEDRRTINLQTNLEFDLATIKEFYPINEDTLAMRGQLTAKASLNGKADQVERAVQSGQLSLRNGYISHKSLGKPIEDLSLESTLDGPTLSIAQASFRTGDNNLSATGSITNYLSDSRTLDIKIDGKAALNEIPNYYDLAPAITKLTGQADMNLRARGPVNDPANMSFDGELNVQNVNMNGEAMVQPVSNLNGQLRLAPQSANLESLRFDIGSSDISLSGALEDYLSYLKSEKDRQTTPHLTGSYQSQVLNMDELINWEDTTTAPIPIHLPDLTSSVSAEIDTLIVTGVTMQNLQAQAGTTPEQIKLDKATIELFDGEASGAFTWDVPQPNRTMISFTGALDSLQAESFFGAYPILGKKSNFHEYVSGAFSADVEYYSELNEFLEPLINTSTMDGSFGMTKSRMQGHPVQDKLASLFKAKEFRNIALDEWTSTYALKNSVFTIKNLRLTSGDIGMELNGTQHLVNGTIDYQTKLFLPGRFKSAIATVITKQAADALTQENGTITVPLRITGTQEDPQVRPDKEVIGPIVKDYLKNKAGDVLKGIFDG